MAPSLTAELALTPANKSVGVYAILREQASAHKLRTDLLARGVMRERRSVEVLRHLRDGNTTAQAPLIASLVRSPGIANVRAHWIVNVVAFEGTPAAIARVAARPDVIAVNRDLPWRIEAVAASVAAAGSPGRVETGVRVIRAPEMWARGYTGFGGVALTADTGVDPFHPAIGHKYAGHDGRPVPWFESEDFPVAGDCGDHGTHVNGTIMGLDRLTGDTIGVAPGAHWLGGAILCGQGTGDNLAIFEWALDPDGDDLTATDRPFVINNSWYDPSIDGVECTAANPYPRLLDNLEAAGIAVVFSAGNSGPDPATITPPHSYSATLTNAFTVGALDAHGLRIADFSSRGPATCSSGTGTEAIDIKPEVAAPGVDVRSCVPGGGYGRKSGTSMAAPHTAGAVLLLHEAFPDLDGDALLRALYYSARDMGDRGEDNVYGRGLIDVDAAYAYLVAAGHMPAAPSRPDVAAEVVAAAGDRRQCAGPIQLSVTVMNTGIVPIESLGYIVEGLDDERRAGSARLHGLAPGDTTTVRLSVASAAEGERFVSFRIRTINGAAADPRLDLGASWGLELSPATPPTAVVDRSAEQLCLNSPIVLSLASTQGDPAVVHFGTDPGLDLLPRSATGEYVIDSLTEAVTLYGLNEYRRRGGPSLDEGDAGLVFTDADTAVLGFRALRDAVLREVTLVTERRGAVTFSIRDVATDEVIGRYRGRPEAGVQKLSVIALLERDHDYRLTVISEPALAYDPSVAVADADLEGIIDFGEVGPEVSASVRGGSFFFYDWSVGYYDGCPTTALTLVPDETREASPREVGTFTTDPTVGQDVEVFDATAPVGTDYTWRLNGEVVATGAGPQATLTPQVTGEQTIRMTLVDDGGCATAADLGIDVVASPSSAPETLAPGQFRLYPNPAVAAFSIDGDAAEVAQVIILDAAGRTVARYPGGIDRYAVSSLPAGTYTVRLVGRGGASRGFVLEVQR